MKESKTICSPAQTSVSLPRKPHATLHVIVAGRGGDILTVQLRFGMTAHMWALISRVVSPVCAKKASNITFDDKDSWKRPVPLSRGRRVPLPAAVRDGPTELYIGN